MKVEKLELKHLAPYLPYGLMIKESYIGKELKMIGCENTKELRIRLTDGLYAYEANNMKPILRPLSDLTDEMIEDIYQRYGRSETNAESWASSLRFLRKYGGTRYELPLEFWNYLFKHHFDLFGLIPSGLAVDINTLK